MPLFARLLRFLYIARNLTASHNVYLYQFSGRISICSTIDEAPAAPSAIRKAIKHFQT